MRGFHTYDTAGARTIKYVALMNIRIHSHWILKYVKDFYAYPPLHVV